MPTDRHAIESFMDEMELKSYSRTEDGNSYWVLLFQEGGVHVRLSENADVLIFRTMGLAKLDSYSRPQQHRLLRHLLQRNNELLLGHYSVQQEIVFETTLPIHDSDVSAEQFRHCLGAMIAEINHFAASEPVMIKSARADERGSKMTQQRLHTTEATVVPRTTPPSRGIDKQNKSTSDNEGFQVVLTAVGSSTLSVVKVVKKCRQLPLVECERIVESVPTPIGCWQTRPEAEAIVRELKTAGATAVII